MAHRQNQGGAGSVGLVARTDHARLYAMRKSNPCQKGRRETVQEERVTRLRETIDAACQAFFAKRGISPTKWNW